MSAVTERIIYSHGRDRDFTKEEYFSLLKKQGEAFDKGDMAEFERIGDVLPIAPEVAKAFKEIYGKEWLLGLDLDLTDANQQFGEGWLDAPDE